MPTPNALMIQTLPGRESVRYIAAELHDRVTAKIVSAFREHNAWRGGNVESIEALAQRAKNAEDELHAILHGDEWHYRVDNEAVRASVTRVLLENALLTGNY